GARFSLIEDLSSAGPDTLAYTNAVVELFVERDAKIEYVSLQNLSRETWHFGRYRARLQRDSELDWVLGGFGSKWGKVWIENDLVGEGATSRVTGAYFVDVDQHLDRERPRRRGGDVACDGCVLRGRGPAPRLRHVPGARGTEHRERLRVQGCATRACERRLARDDPRRGARAEDERLPGEPQPAALERSARGLDPGSRDHGERRPVHARRDARPHRPRAALLPDGARAHARRGRAADRPRLLPGRARPDRPGAGPRGARLGARGADPAGVAPRDLASSSPSAGSRSTGGH